VIELVAVNIDERVLVLGLGNSREGLPLGALPPLIGRRRIDEADNERKPVIERHDLIAREPAARLP
jgi:hypothetical protein